MNQQTMAADIMLPKAISGRVIWHKVPQLDIVCESDRKQHKQAILEPQGLVSYIVSYRVARWYSHHVQMQAYVVLMQE